MTLLLICAAAALITIGIWGLTRPGRSMIIPKDDPRWARKPSLCQIKHNDRDVWLEDPRTRTRYEADGHTADYIRRQIDPNACWSCGKPATHVTTFPPFPGGNGYVHRSRTCSDCQRGFARDGHITRVYDGHGNEVTDTAKQFVSIVKVSTGCNVCGGEWADGDPRPYNPDCWNCSRNHAWERQAVTREIGPADRRRR